MIRCMMLALTLMLITLSAAYLGRDQQLRQVLQSARLPVESSSPAPAASEPPPEPSGPPSSSNDEGGISPRFVLDEPLEPFSAPEPGPEQPDAPEPPEPPIDPSAEARLYSVESGDDYTPEPPTEEQKLAAAEPYVRELFELTERGSAQLRALADEVIGEYLSIAPSERGGSLPALIEKYAPRIAELESRSDSDAETILLRMSAALTAIGADGGLVDDARAAYERTKQEQTARYSELFAAFAPGAAAE